MSDFFTAVSFGKYATSRAERFLENVDDYFYIGLNKKACVVKGHHLQADKATILLDRKACFLALKIFSYFTVFIPVIMLALKAILRARHHFHVINPKEKLEAGMDISHETVQKAQATASKILALSKDEDWNEESELADDANGTSFVDTGYIDENLRAAFTFADPLNPDSLFPIFALFDRNQMTKQQFRNMIKAKEACLYHHFDHLVIPHAKMIEAGGKKLIARNRVEVFEDLILSIHPKNISALTQAVRQLAAFTIETGLTAKTYIENSINRGSRHFVLIHPKSLPCSVEEALFGGYDGIRKPEGLPVLIDSFHSQKHIDVILDEARLHGIIDRERAQRIKASKISELLKDALEHNDLKSVEMIIKSYPSPAIRLSIDSTMLTTLINGNNFDLLVKIIGSHPSQKCLFKMYQASMGLNKMFNQIAEKYGFELLTQTQKNELTVQFVIDPVKRPLSQLKKLVEAGGELVRYADPSLVHPIHLVINRGNKEVVEYLVNKFPDLLHVPFFEDTARVRIDRKNLMNNWKKTPTESFNPEEQIDAESAQASQTLPSSLQQKPAEEMSPEPLYEMISI